MGWLARSSSVEYASVSPGEGRVERRGVDG